ncbi:MAG: hypothetical protein ACREM1_19405 [Longimicrobiales bacterium]
MPRQRKMGAIAGVALVVAVIGCASTTGGSVADQGGPLPTVVIVENNNWSDINVYALRPSGSYVRLGTVTSVTKRQFTLPAGFSAYSGELRLAADPIGSGDLYVSPPIQFAEGDAIVWKVENHLPLSSYLTRTAGTY